MELSAFLVEFGVLVASYQAELGACMGLAALLSLDMFFDTYYTPISWPHKLFLCFLSFDENQGSLRNLETLHAA